MKTLAKTMLVAATLAAATAPAAQADGPELITGVGFGHSRPDALQNAVRAWINQSVRTYGFADWNSALKGQMSCSQQSGGANRAQAIGVEGDVSGNWSCSVSGFPLAAIQG